MYPLIVSTLQEDPRIPSSWKQPDQVRDSQQRSLSPSILSRAQDFEILSPKISSIELKDSWLVLLSSWPDLPIEVACKW